jgi:hypothetical protein
VKLPTFRFFSMETLMSGVLHRVCRRALWRLRLRTLPGIPPYSRGIILLMSLVLHWNGRDVPQELRSLPEGRYVVDAVDAAPVLSDEEEAGLDAALESLRQGRGLDADEVFRRAEERLRR